MLTFLSPEWLAALNDAASRAVDDGTLVGLQLSIDQRIVDGPRYRVRIDDGRVSVDADPEGEADVRFTTDRETAAAVARGDRSALDAFITGDLRVGGNTAALIEHGAAIGALTGIFTAVSEHTDFG